MKGMKRQRKRRGRRTRMRKRRRSAGLREAEWEEY